MKKLIFVVCLIIAVLFAGAAFAQSNEPVNGEGIIEIFMTSFAGIDNAQSYQQVSSFHADETPWLYIKMKDSVPQVVGTWWYDGTGDQAPLFKFDTLKFDPTVWEAHWSYSIDSYKELWLARRDFDEYVEHGQQWYIKTNDGDTDFTVTPEPASMLLFALGGSAFVLSRKRKA